MLIIFDHLAAPWSWADVRGTAPQFCGPKLIDTGHACCDRRCPVRAFDDSTARRSAAAASWGPRREASRAGWRLRRATGSSALFSRRWLPSSSRYFRPQNRGAVIQALPAASWSENNARFLCFLNEFYLYRDRITTNCGPRRWPQTGAAAKAVLDVAWSGDGTLERREFASMLHGNCLIAYERRHARARSISAIKSKQNSSGELQTIKLGTTSRILQIPHKAANSLLCSA